MTTYWFRLERRPIKGATLSPGFAGVSMAAKILALTALFSILTGCHAGPGSLPVIQAAVSTPRTTVLSQADSPAAPVKRLHVQPITTDDIDRQVPKQLCY